MSLSGWLLGMALLLITASVAGAAAKTASPLQLAIQDDGKQIKLLVRHPEIGPICELWCYEGGPFRYGTASRREDGSVVFVHSAGKMTATTIFTPRGTDRVAMDVLVEGPPEELKQILLMGPCMQFWHSEAFRRKDTLAEFAQRCFLYTIRGPVGMMETARGKMSGFPPDALENNPPYTQWYVPLDAPHPGDIWAFGASGDRPLYGLVGATSRDGKWVAAIGCARSLTLGQGWHDCIHHVMQMQAYWDAREERIRHRSMIYVMPNDRRRLLESFRRDFPDEAERAEIVVSAGKKGTLQIGPRSLALEASFDLVGAKGQPESSQRPTWKASPWGGFTRSGDGWRLWAYPHGEAVELWVSAEEGKGLSAVEALLNGKGWTPERTPEGVPALVRRSPDGAWIAALLWEQSATGRPERGALTRGEGKALSLSVRGRLTLFKGGLRERWNRAQEEWKHAVPYRMPVAEEVDSPKK